MLPPVDFSYLTASVFIGTAQVVDALLLGRRNGEVRPTLAYFSLLEYIWAGVSVVVAFKALFVPAWLPMSFVLYVFALYTAARFFLAPTHKPGTPVVIPIPYVILGGVFGLYFAGASVWLLLVARN